MARAVFMELMGQAGQAMILAIPLLRFFRNPWAAVAELQEAVLLALVVQGVVEVIIVVALEVAALVEAVALLVDLVGLAQAAGQ
jgi:hypothetical protein